MNASVLKLCQNDGTVAAVASCRPFDFTIGFESIVLSIVPSALFFALSVLELAHLSKKSNIIPTFSTSSNNARCLYVIKMGVAASFVGVSAVCLGTWSENKLLFPGNLVTVSVALQMVAAISSLLLSHFEHFRTLRPSILLPFYFLSTLLCDAARLRSFAVTGFLDGAGSFFWAFSASFVLRFCFFVTENVEKGRIFREQHSGKVLSPEVTASFTSRILFAWATPLLVRGAKTKLTLDDLDPLSGDWDALALWSKGSARWEQERARPGARHPLVWTLVKAFPSAIFAPIIPCAIYALAVVARPTAINAAITFIESYSTPHPQPVEHGWGLCGAFFLLFAVYGVAYSWFYLAVNQGATMLRGFLIEAIYRKSLRLHVEVAKETGSGKAGSMMSLETDKILLRAVNCYDPLSTLIIVTFALVLLYQQIGASFVAMIVGIIFMFVFTPILAKDIGPAQGNWSNLTDARQKLTSSVIRNFLPVKLSALEEVLEKKIEALRLNEMVAFRVFWLHISKVVVLTNAGSNILNLFTLGTYGIVTIVNANAPPLTTPRMFTVVAIIGTVLMPINNLGQGYASIVAAWSSIKRIEEFLLAEEKGIEPTESTLLPNKAEIVFSDASFGRGDTTFLHNITAVLPHQKLTLVIGTVGSGKSSFLHACLREVDLQSGSYTVPREKTAYCSQDAWLRAESVKDAILFTDPFVETWYRQVLRAITLDKDIEILRDGDSSLVTQLSGGQRQRVALARAVYSRSARVILDDCFSALDANTEEHVFNALFDPVAGLLRGKTVILATNGIHRLSRADHIVVLEAGRVDEQGTYGELVQAGGSTQALVRDHMLHRARSEISPGQEYAEAPASEPDNEVAKDEEGKRGGVGMAVYGFYVKAVGTPRASIYVLLTVVSGAMPVVIQVYQNYWSASIGDDPRHGVRRFLGGYVAVELLYVFTLGMYIVFAVFAAAAGSSKLHHGLLHSVFRASPSTIATIGVGKVLNRFSSDIFLLDFDLPLAFLNVSSTGAMTAASVVIIAVSAPWVALILLGVAAVFTVILRFYTRTSQQLRRLDLGSKTPLYSLLTDTVDADGLRTIRAFGYESHFTAINTERVRSSQKPYYLMNVSRRWLNSTIDMALAVINTALVAFAVSSRHSTSAGIFAIALVQATQLTDLMNHLLMALVELEICIVAIERIKEFTDLPAEEETNDEEEEDREQKAMKEVWPNRGGIRFENVQARYKEEGEMILKGLTFDVPAGSRVGLVGRSGSGKSTTLSTLFRLIPIVLPGRILVDGKDISEINLLTLRSGMSLIPQDPLLLEMSVRDNLDPTGVAGDDEIWAALELSALKTVVEALPAKLEEVISGSSSFSRGQKQLLALARAVLQNKSIVCLDEATSSIDVATDQAVQRTLRTALGNATILTVAHRISTIRDYDVVLVLDNGRLAEHGPPEELLKISGGLFRKLVNGEESEDTEEDGIKELEA